MTSEPKLNNAAPTVMEGGPHRKRRKWWRALGWIGLRLVIAVCLLILAARQPAMRDVVVSDRHLHEWVLDLIDPQAEVRQRGREMVLAGTTNSIPTVLRMLRSHDSPLKGTLVKVASHAPGFVRPTMYRVLQLNEPRRRRLSAAEALKILAARPGGTLPKECLTELRRALDDPDLVVSWQSAMTLAEIKPEGLTELQEALRSPKASTRGLACDAIDSAGAVAVMAAAPALAPLLSDPDAMVAGKASHTLGNGGNAAVEPTRAMLEHGSPDVRMRAALVLGRVGTPSREAIPQLLRLSEETNASVRVAAVEALGKISPAREPVLSRLLALGQDDDFMIRQKALEGLAHSPRASMVAVPRLVELLEHPNAQTRADSARLLGEIGKPALPAMEALRKCLADRFPSVVYEARRAMERLTPRP